MCWNFITLYIQDILPVYEIPLWTWSLDHLIFTMGFPVSSLPYHIEMGPQNDPCGLFIKCHLFSTGIPIIKITHWSQVTHICVDNIIIIGSYKGLSPYRRQAIIWTNAEILLIEPLGTNFSEILIEIRTFLFTKIHLKMLSAKWRPFCLSLLW